MVLFFLIPFVLYKKDKLHKWNSVLRYSQSLLIGMAGVLLLMHAHWLNGVNGVLWGVVFAFLAKAEQCIFQPQQVVITETGIMYSNILCSTIVSWELIEKVVIRADYISIFKKNNRYLQFEITDDLSDVQLKEISELCKSFTS